jgi:hypothetical protein
MYTRTLFDIMRFKAMMTMNLSKLLQLSVHARVVLEWVVSWEVWFRESQKRTILCHWGETLQMRFEL